MEIRKARDTSEARRPFFTRSLSYCAVTCGSNMEAFLHTFAVLLCCHLWVKHGGLSSHVRSLTALSLVGQTWRPSFTRLAPNNTCDVLTGWNCWGGQQP